MRFAAAACAFLLLVARPAHAQLQAQVYVTGLQTPVAFVQDPTDRTVQFVVQQSGRIRVVRNGAIARDRFSQPDELSVVLRRARAARPRVRARLRVERPLLRQLHEHRRQHGRRAVSAVLQSHAWPIPRRDSICSWRGRARFITQPFSNHNGGHLAFGPDGYLYIGLGDGGSGNDPDHRAQNPNELLGKMLRIDVNVPDADPFGYRIPPDNPFLGGNPARDEIWAFGLRNPWRYSFDDVARGGTGALVIGDVGQNRFEEINYEPRGAGGRNYGWRNREGAHDNVTTRPLAYQPATDPIFDYGRSDGISVTGGFVYRGTRLGAAYRGRYFFADYSGRVWSLALTIDAIGRGAGVGSARAHGRARRQRGAREHQLFRRRRRRRALRRQSFRRQDRSHHRAAHRATGPDGAQDRETVTERVQRVQWVQQVRGVRRVRTATSAKRAGAGKVALVRALSKLGYASRSQAYELIRTRQGRGERAASSPTRLCASSQD